MEVSVYINMDARSNNKAVFRRHVVVSPDAFEYDCLVKSMRSVFGPGVVIEFLVV